jgi:hypothetical protein
MVSWSRVLASPALTVLLVLANGIAFFFLAGRDAAALVVVLAFIIQRVTSPANRFTNLVLAGALVAGCGGIAVFGAPQRDGPAAVVVKGSIRTHGAPLNARVTLRIGDLADSIYTNEVGAFEVRVPRPAHPITRLAVYEGARAQSFRVPRECGGKGNVVSIWVDLGTNDSGCL